MTRNILTTLSAVAFGFILAACGGSDGSATGPGPSGTITLRNDANVGVVSVNIAQCTDPEWGANRLNSAETIAPGAVRNWTFPAGCYDVRASTGSKSATWFDLSVTPAMPVQLAVPSEITELADMVPGSPTLR